MREWDVQVATQVNPQLQTPEAIPVASPEIPSFPSEQVESSLDKKQSSSIIQTAAFDVAFYLQTGRSIPKESELHLIRFLIVLI
jgi:hypothetical protein